MSLMKMLFNTDEEIAQAKQEKSAKVEKKPEVKPKSVEVPASTFSEPVKPAPTFTTFTQPKPSPIASVDDELVKAMIENYRVGFASLNKEGYDFYEFYQSVTTAGLDLNQAFNMGKIMNPKITKSSLVNEADFYLNEIRTAHSENSQKGNARLQELEKQKETESQSLSTDLKTFNEQFEQLKALIQDRTNKLGEIDGKYQTKLDEVNAKLRANDLSAESVIDSIENVKTGINNLNT